MHLFSITIDAIWVSSHFNFTSMYLISELTTAHLANDASGHRSLSGRGFVRFETLPLQIIERASGQGGHYLHCGIYLVYQGGLREQHQRHHFLERSVHFFNGV